MKGMPWITTFNDMITLLMVFFVLLFALSKADLQRFKHFRGKLQAATGILPGGAQSQVGLPAVDPIGQSETAGEMRPAPRYQEILSEMAAEGLEIETTGIGMRLSLRDELLFASGSAQLTREGLHMLDRIGGWLRKTHHRIRVEGHTDDVPITTPQFPSNWELSTKRAVNVVKYFVDPVGIEAHRLSAAGYGASRPRAANDSPPARGRNRRVDIILEEIAHDDR